MPPWSQGTGSRPAREGEAGSLDGIEASVGRGKAKLFPLRVDFSATKRYILRPGLSLGVVLLRAGLVPGNP
jgi:hypothetical protein